VRLLAWLEYRYVEDTRIGATRILRRNELPPAGPP
jgi:hypothetical protein